MAPSQRSPRMSQPLDLLCTQERILEILRASGPGLERALERAAEVIGAGRADLSAVAASRLSALARYGLTAKAPLLRELADPRRTATLLAAARHLKVADAEIRAAR
jgi:hypothetical protein